MALAAENFAKRFFLNDRSQPTLLVLAGDNGCGKTHTAKRIYNYCKYAVFTAWENGHWKGPVIPAAAYASWPDIADTDDYLGHWVDLVEASLTVVDDAGAEVDQYRSAKPTENLRRLLGEREGRFTVLTTNVPPVQWAESWDLRVEDRLYRHSQIVELASAPSYCRS